MIHYILNYISIRIYIKFYSIEETPFYGGVFRCRLVIDGEFPNKPPKGYFLTKIFHPNVA